MSEEEEEGVASQDEAFPAELAYIKSLRDLDLVGERDAFFLIIILS